MSGNDESLAQVFQKAEVLFLDIQKSTLASNSDEYQVTNNTRLLSMLSQELLLLLTLSLTNI